MNRFRIGLASTLALCLTTGAGVLAYSQDKTPVAPAPAVPDKAVMDKPVKPFVLKDVTKDLKPGEKDDAAMVALDKFKDKKNVILFFMSERCQVTWRYEKRLGKLMQDMAKKDVAFLGVRCSANDTCQSIRKFAETRNFDMPVLDDSNGAVTKFFGVRQTPTFVLIDKKGALRYQGSFDDDPDEAGAKKFYLRTAVANILESKDVSVKQTTVFG
jgi:peroxiredoxin